MTLVLIVLGVLALVIGALALVGIRAIDRGHQ
jgi:hypothetical protein